jgi:hypothetical protein
LLEGVYEVDTTYRVKLERRVALGASNQNTR